MSSILKNNTSSPRVYSIGHTVPANGQLLIDPANKTLFARSSEVWTDLINGNVTYNDGTEDLVLFEAITHLNDHFPNISGIVGSQGIQGDAGIQGIQGNDGAQGIQGIQGAQGIQGDPGPTGPAGSGGALEEYHYAESLGQSSSSDNWIEKLKLTTSSLIGGFYRMAWSYEHEVDSNNKRMEIRVQLDDTTTISSIAPEIRDDYFFSGGGFRRLNLAAGVHTIDIDFRKDNSHGSIRNVVIELWKVG